MKSFPMRLNTGNKDNFPSILYERIKAYLRRDLFEHIISHSESDYFDIDSFVRARVGDRSILDTMIPEIQKELSVIGWKTQLSYGGTGMFIYSGDPPHNCHPDGF